MYQWNLLRFFCIWWWQGTCYGELYNFICADHPSNVKKGGVGIYYKESIADHIININFLSECLLCAVPVNNKKNYIAVL